MLFKHIIKQLLTRLQKQVVIVYGIVRLISQPTEIVQEAEIMRDGVGLV